LKEACRHSAPFVGSDFSEESFADLREVLLRRRHVDLAPYKDNCIKRRIARRVRALGLGDMHAYLRLLNADPNECENLVAALSIHVSRFFRNPSTFAVLAADTLPKQLRRVRQDKHGRVLIWSVGCAGGEEPYSLALLLDELDPGRRAAILATDISSDVLVRAREGLYDTLRLTEVSAEIRRRYFTPEAGGYRLDAGIRRRVRFQQQDILSATAYPAADLILCRNVLIYFSREEQEKILCRFFAALRPEGVLVLGKAETLIGKARRLFHNDESGERIYRRKDLPADIYCS